MVRDLTFLIEREVFGVFRRQAVDQIRQPGRKSRIYDRIAFIAIHIGDHLIRLDQLICSLGALDLDDLLICIDLYPAFGK